jgi:hypothetical protein
MNLVQSATRRMLERLSLLKHGTRPLQIERDAELRPAVFHDPRLQFVEWRDLVPVRPVEVFTEPLLPAAWLAASLLLAGFGH